MCFLQEVLIVDSSSHVLPPTGLGFQPSLSVTRQSVVAAMGGQRRPQFVHTPTVATLRALGGAALGSQHGTTEEE